VNSLRLVARPITAQERLVAVEEDAASIATYGRTRRLRLNLPALDSYATAQSRARHELLRRRTPQGEVLRFTLRGVAPLAWTLGTRIHVNLPELYHTRDYIIIGEQHHIG